MLQDQPKSEMCCPCPSLEQILVIWSPFALDDSVGKKRARDCSNAASTPTGCSSEMPYKKCKTVKVDKSGNRQDAVLQAIYDANIEDVPGTKAAYHPYSSWFLLGEIIRRISGVPFAQYVREQIFLPLGMDNCYIGMSKDTFERYHADGLFAELRTMTPKGKMLTKGTVQTAPHEVMASVPGSNGRGPARDPCTRHWPRPCTRPSARDLAVAPPLTPRPCACQLMNAPDDKGEKKDGKEEL